MESSDERKPGFTGYSFFGGEDMMQAFLGSSLYGGASTYFEESDEWEGGAWITIYKTASNSKYIIVFSRIVNFRNGQISESYFFENIDLNFPIEDESFWVSTIRECEPMIDELRSRVLCRDKQ